MKRRKETRSCPSPPEEEVEEEEEEEEEEEDEEEERHLGRPFKHLRIRSLP